MLQGASLRSPFPHHGSREAVWLLGSSCDRLLAQQGGGWRGERQGEGGERKPPALGFVRAFASCPPG
jgi:hypothetical protein